MRLLPASNADPTAVTADRRWLNLPTAYAAGVSLAFFGSGAAGVAMAEGTQSFSLFGFPMNAPHGAAHLLLGGIGFVAIKARRELAYAKFMSTVLAFLFLCGNLPQPAFGIIPVGGSDMFLHGLAASLGAVTIAKSSLKSDDVKTARDTAMASLLAIEHTRLLMQDVAMSPAEVADAARAAAAQRLADVQAPPVTIDLDAQPQPA